MAVTLESLQTLLGAPEVPIFSDGTSTLLYRFAHRGQMLLVEATIMEDGGYVRFVIPCYLNLYEAGDRSAVGLKLLELNRFYKLLKFSYDPVDGEICVSIELPVGEGVLAEDQVSRCMYLLTNVAMQERDRLMSLQHTGIYPANEDPNFTQSIERILEGSGADEERDPVDDTLDTRGLDLFGEAAGDCEQLQFSEEDAEQA